MTNAASLWRRFIKPRFAEAGIDVEFVQDNHSRSVQGCSADVHYQISHPQGKLVRVIRAPCSMWRSICEKARRRSAAGTVASFSEANRRQVYVPAGFAHGFCVTSDIAEVIYKCTEIYAPKTSARCCGTILRWASTGRSGTRRFSEKDQRGVPLDRAECFL